MAGKTPSKMDKRNFNANKWFANVAKSLGYSATDVVTSIMPATVGNIKDNREYVKETIHDIREVANHLLALKFLLSIFDGVFPAINSTPFFNDIKVMFL